MDRFHAPYIKYNPRNIKQIYKDHASQRNKYRELGVAEGEEINKISRRLFWSHPS